MARDFRRKYSIRLSLSSKPLHPAVDVAAIIYSLTPRFRIPVAYLRSSTLYVDVTYRYCDAEITKTRSVMVVGDQRVVSDMIRGYRFVASTDHSMNEELSTIIREVGRVVDAFPRLLVVVGQVVPHASLSLIRSVGDKDFVPKGYSISLESLVSMLGGTGYYGVARYVDMSRDKGVDEIEKIYAAVVPSHDVTTVVVVANAPRLVEVMPSRIREYVNIPWGGGGEHEEG